MAIPVNAVKKGKQGSGGIGQLIGTGLGAAAGFAIGGPAGAVTGAGLGGNVGGAVGSRLNPQTGDESKTLQTPGDAISRRLSSMQGDNLTALRDAAFSLPQLPPEMQQQY